MTQCFPLCTSLSEITHRKDFFHSTYLINILVTHLPSSAHLVVVMNTDDMGPTHELKKILIVDPH